MSATGRWLVPVALIARRELVERAKMRSFQMATIILVLVGVGLTLAASTDDESVVRTYTVGLVGPGSAELEPLLEPLGAPGVAIRAAAVGDAATARERVAAGELDAAVIDGTTIVVGPGTTEVLGALRSAVATAELSRRLERSGLSPTEAAQVLEPSDVVISQVEPESDDDELVGFVASMLLYLALLLTGTLVANGVAEEKSTQMSEVLLSVVRPTQLLAGKVTGIGCLGLAQLLAVGLPLLAAQTVTGSVELPSATPAIAASAFAWFVLGYALYSCAYAALGASVSRQEEVGSAVLPLSILLVMAYLIGVTALDDPDTTLVTVASFLPPTAPIAMLIRTATGDLPWWEPAIAMALTALAALALIQLGARVYGGAVLRTGTRVRLRDALARS